MRALGASRTSLVPGGVLAGPWVRDDLWRRARAVPSLDLRFADNKSLVDAVTGASLITFTRASSGTYTDSAGVLQTASTNVPRFDHNPITGESLGLLVEEQRTNLLLNSGTLSTQSVTVTAVAHTLSFTSTGTITLTGTSSAGPLVGTGTGEGNRVSLTFTPTAGSLTLTVSGTVTNAQLEAGAFRTSYISTAGAAVTRNADVASITGSAFSGWYRQDEGTVFAECAVIGSTGVTQPILHANAAGADTPRIMLIRRGDGRIVLNVFSTVSDADIDSGVSLPVSSVVKSAAVYKVNDFVLTASGVTPVLDTSGNVPTVDRIGIGFRAGAGTYLNGHIRRFCYWNQRLANSTLQGITQ